MKFAVHEYERNLQWKLDKGVNKAWKAYKRKINTLHVAQQTLVRGIRATPLGVGGSLFLKAISPTTMGDGTLKPGAKKFKVRKK